MRARAIDGAFSEKGRGGDGMETGQSLYGEALPGTADSPVSGCELFKDVGSPPAGDLGKGCLPD